MEDFIRASLTFSKGGYFAASQKITGLADLAAWKQRASGKQLDVEACTATANRWWAAMYSRGHVDEYHWGFQRHVCKTFRVSPWMDKDGINFAVLDALCANPKIGADTKRLLCRFARLHKNPNPCFDAEGLGLGTVMFMAGEPSFVSVPVLELDMTGAINRLPSSLLYSLLMAEIKASFWGVPKAAEQLRKRLAVGRFVMCLDGIATAVPAIGILYVPDYEATAAQAALELETKDEHVLLKVKGV